MKNNFIFSTIVVLSFLGTQETFAQSCETTSKNAIEEVSNPKGKSIASPNSGCTPSACRGAKTKFGEAKVITDLRLNLIELKSMMENDKRISFHPRSYDIHGLVGETDDESLEIIKDEIEIIQKEFSEKLDINVTVDKFPENKAKQVSLIKSRLSNLKKQLQ